ncbi:sigma-70 family RNA polymerase sigma factor [Streptomyces sp. NPDC057686]|uniref:sigma-70 family RNA polymerase sigma factor n=1 Tax=Streptomyces sp. NPDC057686 TaxID=3346212 RepID=UPI0036AC6AE8
MLIGDPLYPCCTGTTPAQATVPAPRRAAHRQPDATSACAHHHRYVPYQLACGLASVYQPRKITSRELEKEFVTFLGQNVKRLFRIAYRQESNLHRSEDALQAATAKLWRNWPIIRITVGEKYWAGYSSSCVIRSYYDLLKKERSESGKAVKLRLEREPPNREYLNIERRIQVAALLDLLPPRQRDIIRMRYFEEMQIAEISKQLNISVSTVGREEKKAMAFLKEAEKQE